MKLRAIDPDVEHPLEIAKRAITQHRNRRFRWSIPVEERAKLEMVSFREKPVDRKLVEQVRRMRRYGTNANS